MSQAVNRNPRDDNTDAIAAVPHPRSSTLALTGSISARIFSKAVMRKVRAPPTRYLWSQLLAFSLNKALTSVSSLFIVLDLAKVVLPVLNKIIALDFSSTITHLIVDVL